MTALTRRDPETIARMAAERCWSTIGVWGTQDSRCTDLWKVIHCHNCEVFAHAGRELLERDAPIEYRREWTEILTQSKEAGVDRGLPVLVFRLCDEWYALPTEAFREVAEPRTVRTLPHRSNAVLRGLVNMRGELLLCVWLEGLLGLSRAAASSSSSGAGDRARGRMVVIGRGNEHWVFAVDEIDGIHFFGRGNLREVPVTVSKDKAAFTKGLFRHGERDIGFLDLEMALSALRRRCSRTDRTEG